MGRDDDGLQHPLSFLLFLCYGSIPPQEGPKYVTGTAVVVSEFMKLVASLCLLVFTSTSIHAAVSVR